MRDEIDRRSSKVEIEISPRLNLNIGGRFDFEFWRGAVTAHAASPRSSVRLQSNT